MKRGGNLGKLAGAGGDAFYPGPVAWKPSTMKARARMRLVARDAKNAAGVALTCECGGPLDAYDLEREMERTKTVLCCRKAACVNSAAMSAQILRAELVKKPKETKI